MTEQAITILDTALRYSLWIFLGVFCLAVAISAFRSRQHKLKLRRLAEEAGEGPQSAVLQASSQDLSAVFRSLIVAFAAALAAFLVLTLAPLPLMENFANSESWRLQPLRLTQLTQKRLSKGFELRGEVYNQTEEPIEQLAAVVQVYGIDERVLDEVQAYIDPLPLPPGEAGEFKVAYRKEPANLYGYDIVFVGSEGILPHMRGFDVRDPQLPDESEREPQDVEDDQGQDEAPAAQQTAPQEPAPEQDSPSRPDL